MATVQETMLVKVDTAANNNKFYAIMLNDDDSVTVRYGRVGATGTTYNLDGGRAQADELVRQKTRKGYKPVDVVGSSANVKQASQANLAEIAKQALVQTQHRGDKQIEKLIDQLVKMNRHEIIASSGGLIQVNTAGQISTPVGILQGASLDRARRVLTALANARPESVERNHLVEEYLQLVPQKVPMKRGWEKEFLAAPTQISEQSSFLDQLRDSLTWYEQAQSQAAKAAAGDPKAYADLFRVQISTLPTRSREYKRIEQLYKDSRNLRHASHRLRLKQVYELHDGAAAATYQNVLAEIGNERMLWHGTRAFNVLSIMRKGLFIPPRTGGTYQTTGRMFGDGVYFSDQSTKSLNYSYGYWDHGTRDSSCFMLLANVALGHEFKPRYFDQTSLQKAHHGVDRHGRKFNSINVQGGTCNVLNNELIVWDAAQIELKFLVEFAA